MTLLNDRPRTRRRTPRMLAGVTALAASSALLATGIAPAPAQAAPDLPVVVCQPGDAAATEFGDTANCRKAAPAIIAKLGDGLLGLILPDAGINLSDLNSATAISLKPILGDFVDAGSATITGSGLASAISVAGTANANAHAIASAAISVGSLGGVADSRAIGGLGLSIATGMSKTSVLALPAGIAIALGMGENASATALGGFASAVGVLDAASGASDPKLSSAICTAAYGSAQVSDGVTGENFSSCTSVAFIFQKSQQGDGPVVYAIKNPFSLTFAAPLAPLNDLLDTVAALGIAAPFPASVTDILTGKVIPSFTSDLLRVTMTDDGPKLGTDLFGQTQTQQQVPAPADVTPVAESTVLAPEIAAAPAPEPTVVEPVVEPAPEPTVVEPVVESVADPVVDAPVVEPVVEEAAAPAADDSSLVTE
ncbi:hypothetical protein [Gordonia sp. (in: high G+C Gram-positive bacteria)]|uniref:hypothetical protein n=1 Tax=Gordonia sp. (in: high G+C Gram-positive bacteria) TaxID=84139 RepID=UPI003C73A28A